VGKGALRQQRLRWLLETLLATRLKTLLEKWCRPLGREW